MTIALGDITIQPVVEDQFPFLDPMNFFPKLTKEILEENRGWLEPRHIDPKTGKLLFAFQSFLIKTPQHNILIDTCVGNDKPRAGGRFPFWHEQKSDRFEKNLKAAGLTFADIDFVMCTHLHVDHVGWNTRLENGRWVPTFPKARYLVADRELEFWTAREKQDPSFCPQIRDSVLPIVEAQRVDLVKSDHQFSDQIKLIPTPGHTIDHFSVHVGKPGKDAVITGDMIHSPLQARYPELGMLADYDSAEAGRSRRRVFGQFCDTSTVFCTAHFSAPSTGRVTRWDDGFRFVDL